VISSFLQNGGTLEKACARLRDVHDSSCPDILHNRPWAEHPDRSFNRNPAGVPSSSTTLVSISRCPGRVPLTCREYPMTARAKHFGQIMHKATVTRRAQVRDAATVARHRAAMFRDMGGSL
jgi:hypothetical protein